MKKGMLISFEGGEASGKTTQIKKFVSFLKENGFDVVGTKEQGGTFVGEAIRNILLHTNFEISARAEALLFNASRCQLVADVVKPSIKEGKIVVMDRYFDSTYAYEGSGGQLSEAELKTIIDFAIDGSVPDVTFLLDIGFDESRMRKAADEKLKNLDRFENKEREYHEKVRQGYLNLAKKSPERFVVINASLPEEKIFEIIIKEFEKTYNAIQK